MSIPMQLCTAWDINCGSSEISAQVDYSFSANELAKRLFFLLGKSLHIIPLYLFQFFSITTVPSLLIQNF